jgi:hypothetical protein
MKRLLPIICGILCFAVGPASAQVTNKDKLSYKSITEPSTEVNSKFRFKEIKLDAGDIENKAQLIQLRYDDVKEIVRLQDTELIEDDAPGSGIPEGYNHYIKGPVEWVEDLKKGVVIKKVLVVSNPSAVSGRVVFKGMEIKGNKQPLYGD